MQSEAVVVFITTPSLQAAETIAAALLEQKLAACANILPGVTSLYVWKGELNRDQEVLMIVKTRAELFEEKLVPTVKAMHPYELPEIIALPISAGLPAYLEWIKEVTA